MEKDWKDVGVYLIVDIFDLSIKIIVVYSFIGPNPVRGNNIKITKKWYLFNFFFPIKSDTLFWNLQRYGVRKFNNKNK